MSAGWPSTDRPVCAVLHLVESRSQFAHYASLDTLKANRPYVMQAYGHWHPEAGLHRPDRGQLPSATSVRSIRLGADLLEAAASSEVVGVMLNALQLLATLSALTGRVPVVPEVGCQSRWLQRHAMTPAGVADDYVLQLPAPGRVAARASRRAMARQAAWAREAAAPTTAAPTTAAPTTAAPVGREANGGDVGAAEVADTAYAALAGVEDNSDVRCHLSIGGARCSLPEVLPAWQPLSYGEGLGDGSAFEDGHAHGSHAHGSDARGSDARARRQRHRHHHRRHSRNPSSTESSTERQQTAPGGAAGGHGAFVLPTDLPAEILFLGAAAPAEVDAGGGQQRGKRADGSNRAADGRSSGRSAARGRGWPPSLADVRVLAERYADAPMIEVRWPALRHWPAAANLSRSASSSGPSSGPSSGQLSGPLKGERTPAARRWMPRRRPSLPYRTLLDLTLPYLTPGPSVDAEAQAVLTLPYLA